uniref:Uncharacterized protein n=1 Tax=Siphoviridae sp. ctLNL10 TaxID=2825453 RepID=A0A8S5Q4Y2_9CAUD|nr:MAG TPA: hypothetical protein [Siphoviridae sp. ctLNL10]DAJ07228.1 MAG TPA: hypothetical protein [Caudoviricetes sp.]
MHLDIAMNHCGAGGAAVHKTVSILGTEYKIEIHSPKEDECLKRNDWIGYCDGELKLIVLADLDDDERYVFDSDKQKDVIAKETLRHEIVHAFLNESGLQDNALQYSGAWAQNEELVDWIAIQFPKIQKVYEGVGCL